jgi:hypothetical protein
MKRAARSASPCAALVLAICVGSALPAGAGVEIALVSRDARDPGTAERTGRLLCDGARVRIDAPVPQAAAPEQSLLFDGGGGGRLAVLDHARHSVVRLDRAGLADLAARSRAAREEWEARLATLAPEQRAVLERMSGGRLAAAAPLPLRLEPEPGERRLRGVPARPLGLWRGNARIGELWLASWRAAGVPRTELRAVRELGAFARDLHAALGEASPLSGTPHPLELFADLPGYPLRAVAFEAGVPAVLTDFGTARSAPLDPALFEVPAGYQESRGGGLTAPGEGR